ncbi:MAG: acyltransferase [Paraclostridium sordellii]
MKYKIKKLIYKLIGRNNEIMEINLEYYRSKGSKIGNNVRTFSPLVSAEPYLLEIGDDVTVSGNVKFITHDNSVSKFIDNKTDIFGKIKIGNKCFIGYGSIILPGVEIGDNTIIGAGSVVTKSFKDGKMVIAGNPAKVITSTDDYKLKIEDNTLNTRRMSFEEKKKLIIDNNDKIIKK